MKRSCICSRWTLGKGRLSRLCSCRTQWEMEPHVMEGGQQESGGEAWSDSSPCNSHLPQPTYIAFYVPFKRDATKTQHQLWDFWEAGDYKKLLSVTLRNWRKGSWFLVQAHIIGTSLLNLFTHHSITPILHTPSLRGKRCSSWLKSFYFRQKRCWKLRGKDEHKMSHAGKGRIWKET